MQRIMVWDINIAKYLFFCIVSKLGCNLLQTTKLKFSLQTFLPKAYCTM